MRFEEGQIGGARALRLRASELGRITLIYAPAIDPTQVIARMPERLAAQCDRMQVLADRTVQEAVRLPAPAQGFGWELASLDAVYRGVIVGINACGRRVDLVDADLEVLREFLDRARAMAEARPSAGGETPAPISEATEPGADPTRAWLDANRDVILGCASQETVIVRVEAIDGAAHVSLQPPLADTPQEECVQAALREVPTAAIPTTRIIHAVR